MPCKEWTKSIKGADDIELGIPRTSPLIYHCTAPESGKADGLAFVIPDFGEDPSGAALRGLRSHLAETHNLLAVTVEYHCLRSRLSDGARLDVSPAELAVLSKLCAQHGVALLDPNAMLTALAQLPQPYEFEFRVIPPNGDYQNLGLMQALDHFAVLQDILTSMGGAGFEAGNVLAMGVGYGAYLAHLLAKIAPNTLRAVFDFAGLTEAPLSYLFGSRFGDAAPYYYHAGKVRVFPLIASKWSNDAASPHYFSTARRAIRDMASLRHIEAMRQSARQPCCYRIGLLSQDKEGFIATKRRQAEMLAGAGFDVALREYGEYTEGGVDETIQVALLRTLFEEYYPQLPAGLRTPDHVLGSSIAYDPQVSGFACAAFSHAASESVFPSGFCLYGLRAEDQVVVERELLEMPLRPMHDCPACIANNLFI